MNFDDYPLVIGHRANGGKIAEAAMENVGEV